jgi:hypothetical protein
VTSGHDGSQLSFGFLRGREIVGTFDGGALSTDGGVVLVAEADRQLGLVAALGRHLRDVRQQSKVWHQLPEMLAQRILQIACGYEDCNDADDLRSDPMFKTAVGRLPETGRDLSSQPTLSRFENSITRTQLRRMAEVFVDVFFAQYANQEPNRIVLDFDATDDETHGQQQFSEFNGYYDEHCYLPLIVTARVDGGPDELLVAMLRRGKCHASTDALAVLKRLVARLRARWPGTQIVLRADNGFTMPEITAWCDANHVHYLLNLAQNSRLLALAEPYMQDARAEFEKTGEKVRHLHEVTYAAGTWPHERRVLVKAEVMTEGENPRFVVTSLTEGDPEELYDEYAMRGDAENRIKELKNDLKSDRTSCHRFVANQFRVFLHAAAFCLLSLIRKGLAGTRLENAQACTIQRHILKLGVRVTQTFRRVWLHFSSHCPVQDLWPELMIRMRTRAAPT